MASGDTLLVFTPYHNEPPASLYATLDLRNSRPVLDFDGTADEEAVFTAVLPRHYAGGGLTAALLVAFTSATSGTSRWQAAIERVDVDGLDTDTDSFASFQSNGLTAPGVSGRVGLCEIALTPGSQMDSLVAGELFRLRIRRDADGTSGTDDIATDAELVAVELRET